jgi:hypothetical protein
MKLTRILLSTFGIAALAFAVSSCDKAASNNTTANNANKNTAVVVNTNQTTKNDPTPASNTKTANDSKPAANTAKTSNAAKPADSESEPVSGELQTGKTESVILYVGEETGDYAAYCFTNDSEAGRAILAACKNKEQCEVMATFSEEGGNCKVPGLEASLSASFRIAKVVSAKSLGRRK